MRSYLKLAHMGALASCGGGSYTGDRTILNTGWNQNGVGPHSNTTACSKYNAAFAWTIIRERSQHLPTQAWEDGMNNDEIGNIFGDMPLGVRGTTSATVVQYINTHPTELNANVRVINTIDQMRNIPLGTMVLGEIDAGIFGIQDHFYTIRGRTSFQRNATGNWQLMGDHYNSWGGQIQVGFIQGTELPVEVILLRRR